MDRHLVLALAVVLVLTSATRFTSLRLLGRRCCRWTLWRWLGLRLWTFLLLWAFRARLGPLLLLRTFLWLRPFLLLRSLRLELRPLLLLRTFLWLRTLRPGRRAG